ncbi:hypothetical protein EVA_11589 [gut metagenome]|uniref:Uncharacterized protein n=1 Tax=gut metagenome TaxID=749906 RepID=J9CJP3_9ZZZZ
MLESGFYPAGAEHDPRAPYNEPLEEDYEFDVTLDYYDEDGNYSYTDNVVVTLSLATHPNSYNKLDIVSMLYDSIGGSRSRLEIIDYKMVS